MNTRSKNHLIKYKAGDGNDLICGFRANSTLSIAGGSYSTQVNGYDVLVKVGSGSIRLKNVYATADTLHINNKTVKLKRKAIKLTADNNQLEAARDSISIVGSSSDDLIKNYGANVTLSGGKGNDKIENNSSNVLVSGGAGDDYIFSEGSKATLNGGAGRDTIYNYGEGATINGGKGDDTVFLGSSTNHLIQYKSGDGSDIVYGFKTTSTLQIGGSYSTQASGNDVLVNVGKETVTLKNVYASADKLHINNETIKLKRKAVKLTAANNWIEVSRDSISVVGSSSDDDISNYANKVTISAGKGNDYIDNQEGSSNVLINGGAGDDEISNWGGSNVTIDGGKGNDRINIYNGENEGSNISINGGAGDDEISNWGGTNVTLNGGAGDDYLVGGDGKDIFVYKPGEGTDRIFDYSSDDMLKILKSNGKSGGSFTKSKFSDGTLSLTIAGGGQVIFNDVAQGDKFNINGKTYTLGASKLK